MKLIKYNYTFNIYGNGNITDLFAQRLATFVATASSSNRRRTSWGDTPFFTWVGGRANHQKTHGYKWSN